MINFEQVVAALILFLCLAYPLAAMSCLVEECTTVSIWKRSNTWLAEFSNYSLKDKTIWFNGQDLIMYGVDIDEKCPDNDIAIVWKDFDANNQLYSSRGIICAKKLSDVKKMYVGKAIKRLVPYHTDPLVLSRQLNRILDF